MLAKRRTGWSSRLTDGSGKPGVTEGHPARLDDEARPAEPIGASGHATTAVQAGHMTASNSNCARQQIFLASRGPSTHGVTGRRPSSWQWWPSLRVMVSMTGVGREPAPSIIEGRPWSTMRGLTCRWTARACVWWMRRSGSCGGEDCQRASGIDRLVPRDWPCDGADRAGGRSAVAVTVCGDARGWACGRTAGDPTRPRCVQGDAGEG